MFYSSRMKLPPPDPSIRLRARGAASNPDGRFETLRHEIDPEAWSGFLPQPGDQRLLRTQVRIETPRSVLNHVSSPDLGFDRTINPYRGCEHGCVYCFARPGHSYLGMSPGLDFETKLIARPDAPRILECELARRGYRVAPVAIGTNTDPYQPIEHRYRIMREILQVLSDWNHPVSIVTRGTLIERDVDILSDMAARGLVHVGLSVTTLDAGLARRMEPRAPAPERRLAIIRALAGAGVPVRVMVAPVIPGLTDHEMESILKSAAEAGARAASWILLRLPHEVADLFSDWLERAEPLRARKVMNRLRQMHGGRDYDPRFGHRMRGQGVHADLLSRRFRIAVRRLGLDGDLPPLDCSRFCRPPRRGDQLSLFE